MGMTQNAKSIGLALVTGGGRRLGREMALKLADMGYAVGIHYHSSEHAAGQVQETIQRKGGQAFLFQADLARPDQIESLFKAVDDTQIPLRVLVNSASVMTKAGMKETALEEWEQTMNVNLRAVWLCTQLGALRMEKTGGSIINLSDSCARKLWTGYAAYTISKAGVELLTRLAAKTYAPKIRVNAIAPGLILPSSDLSEEAWKKLVDKLPLKREGEPGYICSALEFLLTNDYITGQVFVIDGGYQLV